MGPLAAAINKQFMAGTGLRVESDVTPCGVERLVGMRDADGDVWLAQDVERRLRCHEC